MASRTKRTSFLVVGVLVLMCVVVAVSATSVRPLTDDLGELLQCCPTGDRVFNQVLNEVCCPNGDVRSYNPLKEEAICCGDGMLDIGKSCCGNKQYDANTHTCCGTKIYKTDASLSCCVNDYVD